MSVHNDPLRQHKLQSLSVYNPDLLSEEELKATFVARQSSLDHLTENLSAEYPTHTLLVGVRGMGKTTLLRRLRYQIQDIPRLNKRWVPLVFPEEQYDVTTLGDFYLNCLDALSDYLESQNDTKHTDQVDRFIDQLGEESDETIAEAAREGLRKLSELLGRGFVLLVDNVERILDDLSEREGWAFRDFLSEENCIVLVGGTTQAIESSYKYDQPFYDFFEIRELRGFTAEETESVLRTLAERTDTPKVAAWIDRDPSRMRSLNDLAGGNPRTVVLLFNLIAQGSEGDVFSDLERLLDMCTPLYKARFEELSPQAQKILHALALAWDPATAADLADATRLDVTKVSSQLTRLVQSGVVQKVAVPPSKRTGYQVAERFFNIWYLMRASRRVRKKLLWLTRFLTLLYSKPERSERVTTYLETAAPMEDTTRHVEYGLALAAAVSATEAQAIEFKVLATLTGSAETRATLAEHLDLDGAEQRLRPVAERLKAMAEARDQVLNAPDDAWPPELSRQEFWLLLGGSFSMTIDEKMHAVAQVLTGQPSVKSLHAALLLEKKWLLTIAFRGCGSWVYEAFSEALASGYLQDPNDIDSAAAAGAALGKPNLPVLVDFWRASYGKIRTPSAYHEFAAIAPESPSPWNGLGNLFSDDLGRYEDAEEAYRKAIELDPKYASPWNGLGNLFSAHLGRYEDAEEAFRKAIELDPKYASPWNGLGNLFSAHLGRYEDAEEAFRKAIELDPKYAYPWNGLGNLFKNHLGRYEDAEEAFRKAIELDPKYASPWNGLGILLKNHLGRYEDAEEAFRKAIELDPKYAYPWNGLGNLFSDHLGRYEDAEEAFRKAIELDPKYASPWNGLGNLFSDDLGRYEDAEEAYRKAIELDPKYASPWNGLGNLFSAHLGRYEDAEEAFRKAIELDPKYASPWNGLGNLFSDHLGRYEDAEEAYRKAIELDPKYAYPWNGLGNLFSAHLGRYEDAEEAYRKAIELDPKYASPWNGLGNLLKNHLGRYEDAEEAYRKAIELDPKSASLWLGLGNLFSAHLGRYEDAEEAYRKAIELDPKSAYPWLGLGNLFSDHLGRYEDAEEAYRKAIELDPKSAYPWLGLGNLFSDHLGRYEDAEEAYRKAIEANPKSSTGHNGLAWFLFQIGERDEEALTFAQRAYNIEPESPEVAHTLGIILVRLGKWESAKEPALSFLSTSDETFFERTWPDVVRFFREAVATGRVAESLDLLETANKSQQWRPLTEALKAIDEKSEDRLQRLAPEFRRPAEQLYEELTAS